jgi:hypothetical protein
LNNHPQFRASIPVDNGKTAFKIRVDDAVNARDPSTLKLNHALHLKPGLRGKDGAVSLACSSCHQLAPDRLTLKPVQFEERALKYLTNLKGLTDVERSGWVAGLGHGVLPGTPERNVKRYVELVREVFK